MKHELSRVRVDIKVHITHINRSPSLSKARDIGISIRDTLKENCWKSESVF